MIRIDKIIMKKLLIAVLLIGICFSFCACSSGNNVEEVETIEDKVIDEAENYISAVAVLRYGANYYQMSSTAYEFKENVFKVNGTIKVRENGNIVYSDTYEVEVEYDPDMDECEVVSVDY